MVAQPAHLISKYQSSFPSGDGKATIPSGHTAMKTPFYLSYIFLIKESLLIYLSLQLDAGIVRYFLVALCMQLNAIPVLLMVENYSGRGKY